MARVTLRGMLRSSGIAGIAQVVRATSSLLLTPIVLAAIGLEGFGVWALLFSLSNSIHVMGVSFGNAYAKFTAEYDARRDYEGLAERIGSGLVMISGLSALGLSLLGFFRFPLLRLIGVPEALVPSAATALLTVSITVFGMLSLGCVRQILGGLQRTDLGEATKMASSVVYLAVGAWLVTEGHGLVGLALANLAAEAVGIALGWYWCRRLCPQLVISPFRASARGMRETFALGGRFQILFALNYASNEGFKVMLGVFLGPSLVGAYELSRRLIRLCHTAANAIHQPMMPALANLHSAGESARAREMHDRGATAIFTAGLLAIGFVAAFADRALLLWTAEAQPLSALTFRALAFAYVFKQLSSMGTASLRARGEFRLEIYSMVFSLVTRLGLVLALYKSSGYMGFVWSEAIAHISTTLVFLWPYAKSEGFGLVRFIRRAALRPTLLLGPAIALVYVLSDALTLPLSGLDTRMRVFVELAVWGTLYSILAIGLIWFGVLAASERARFSASLATRLGASRS